MPEPSDYSNEVRDKLLNEAKMYPDQRTDVDFRTFTLEKIYEQAGINKMDNIRALVLGTGQGADLRAIKRLNHNAMFIDAVDAYPPTDSHDIKGDNGEVLVRTTKEEIVGYLDNEKNKDKIRKVNLIVGTRIGPNTIMHIISHLPKDSNYLGVFTTDAQDMSEVLKEYLNNTPQISFNIYQGNVTGI